ncbi:MAG: hypothetical protein LIR47_07225 [Spirochaetota bacterium]|nr:hypothetical protein [Spirochaetota bacterium]
MRLLAASSITFTDLSDASGAMLTSDVLLVPCDSAGVPKLALGSSPLTSRMIILQGGVEQTGWSFSRIQQGVTSSVDSSGVVSVTAISADNGYVEITATKTGQTPLLKKLTVTKVYQGDTGEPGPQGPMGNPGQLGMYAVGTVLYVKGFSDDGTLTAPTGIIYVEGQRYVVPAYSQTLTADGKGYVIFTGTSVQFAKLKADGSSKRWEPYNGGSAIASDFFVLGSFIKNGAAIDDIYFSMPERAQDFERSHFMDILATGEIQDINVWAQANGMDQVFQRIAVLEAFINKIFANEVEMALDGILKSKGYDEDGNGMPVEGYQLKSKGGVLSAVLARLRAARILDATITGNTVIDVGDSSESLFKTQYGSSGVGSYPIPIKTRWKGSDAYNSVAAGAAGEATYNSSTSEYDKYLKTVPYTANANGALLLIGINSSIQPKQADHTVTHAGVYHIYASSRSVLGSGSSTHLVKINNVVITQRTSSTSGNITTYSQPHYLNVGDVIHAEVGGDYQGAVSISFSEYALVLYKGTINAITNLFAIRNNNSAYAVRVTIGSAFDSNNFKSLAPVDAWYNALANNQTMPCTSASSISIDGSPYTAKYLSRTPGTLTIITTGGDVFTFSAPSTSGDPSQQGWHNISGTIYPAGEPRGLLVSNLLPIGSDKEIGEPGNRFNYGYFKTLDAVLLRGNVNSEGTGNLVYGAVFN